MIDIIKYKGIRELKELVENNVFILFGGGKFGIKAFNSLKEKGNCIIIDIDPKIEQFEDASFIRNKEINPLTILEGFKTGRFNHIIIKGSIDELILLLSSFIPKILVPVAPIHIMAELYIKLIEMLNPKIKIKRIKLKETHETIKLPKNLNRFIAKNNTVF